MSSTLRDGFSAYRSKFFAHELARSYANDHVGKLAGLLFDGQVEPKPHQIDGALFALGTPCLPGVLLADEGRERQRNSVRVFFVKHLNIT